MVLLEGLRTHGPEPGQMLAVRQRDKARWFEGRAGLASADCEPTSAINTALPAWEQLVSARRHNCFAVHPRAIQTLKRLSMQ